MSKKTGLSFQLLLKPKGAPGRLAGSTGTLTAAVMFHVGQLVSLPSVGYLTRLDKFMFGQAAALGRGDVILLGVVTVLALGAVIGVSDHQFRRRGSPVR